MVRACALAVVCSLGLLPVLRPSASAQDPFGSGEVKPAGEKGENPFADSPTEPANSDPLAREPVKQKQVALTNSHETARRAKPLCTNERVRSALDETTRMEFIDTPLQDVVNFLRDYHQIEIQLDNRALEDAGVGSDTPMSRDLDSLPLKSALRILLNDADLAYVVKNDVLMITTKDKAAAMREVRVYDVTRLVAPDAKAPEVGQMLTQLLSESPQQSVDGTLVVGPPGLQTVRIVPLGDFLVIRASQEDHDEIAEVLMDVANAYVERR